MKLLYLYTLLPFKRFCKNDKGQSHFKINFIDLYLYRIVFLCSFTVLFSFWKRDEKKSSLMNEQLILMFTPTFLQPIYSPVNIKQNRLFFVLLVPPIGRKVELYVTKITGMKNRMIFLQLF